MPPCAAHSAGGLNGVGLAGQWRWEGERRDEDGVLAGVEGGLPLANSESEQHSELLDGALAAFGLHTERSIVCWGSRVSLRVRPATILATSYADCPVYLRSWSSYHWPF